MKRFPLFMAMLLLAVPITAQVRISKVEHPTRKVADLTSVSMLIERDSSFFIVLRTDNRYDDAVVLPLGDGKEEALATLDNLEAMMQDVVNGDTFYIWDYKENEYFVKQIAMTKSAYLTSSSKAGKAILHTSAIQRAKKALQRE